jgi:CheY-like chemotaxis protein
MPSSLLVAGLDARSLLLEAPVLQRDRHVVEERTYARDVLREIVPTGARLVVLGPELPDLTLPDAVRRIRNSPATRDVSVLAILPAGATAEIEEETRRAGANAVLRRPLDRPTLEAALAKLLVVPRRVVARVPVSGQVVASSRNVGGAHFCGLTHNLSVNGMLLASPLRLADEPDLDLEFVLPGVRARLRALGRVVREAPEVAWPFRGYGVEFLFVPEESHTTITLVVSGALRPARMAVALPDPTHGIHSTVCREEWVYEIREPVESEQGWEAEIRRAPRETWRPGIAGPFFVVAAASPAIALREARAFVGRQG